MRKHTIAMFWTAEGIVLLQSRLFVVLAAP
jgi:hypothetical protein